jgi:hypothetical protein
MAEQLLLCAENIFNKIQFPNHTVTGQEEPTGYPAANVANGRRQAGDRWQPSTANADRYLRVICDQPRGIDFWAIDRESNHRGYRYQALGSSDTFGTVRTIWDINAIPYAVGGLMSGPNGCVTSEGAWLKTHAADGHNGYELLSKAMGAGLQPQITGLWAGKAFQPSQFMLQFPVEDQKQTVQFVSTKSLFDWRGKGQIGKARRGTLRIALPNEDDEEHIEYHVLNLMARGFPAWICWQRESAPWRSLLVGLDEGADLDFKRDPSWHPLYRSIAIPFVEEQPA